jgi:hypothetical protein
MQFMANTPLHEAQRQESTSVNAQRHEALDKGGCMGIMVCLHKGFDAGEFDAAGGVGGVVVVVVGAVDGLLGGRHPAERNEREHDLANAQAEREHPDRARLLAHAHDGRRAVHGRRRRPGPLLHGWRLRRPPPLLHVPPRLKRLRLPSPTRRHYQISQHCKLQLQLLICQPSKAHQQGSV